MSPDVVVVGAGTVGGWAGWFARQIGARVTVVERNTAGQGASSRAAGIVRAQGGTPTAVARAAAQLALSGGTDVVDVSDLGLDRFDDEGRT